MASRVAVFGLVVSLLAPLPANAQLMCTEIGCVNGLTLRVDPNYDWKTGSYDFHFSFDGRTAECHGELPLKKCEDGPSLSCNKKGITIVESGCALPASAHGFGDIHIDGAPKKVMVRIAHNGQTIVTRTLVANYQKIRPNGPQCGPVCESASYDLLYAR